MSNVDLGELLVRIRADISSLGNAEASVNAFASRAVKDLERVVAASVKLQNALTIQHTLENTGIEAACAASEQAINQVTAALERQETAFAKVEDAMGRYNEDSEHMTEALVDSNKNLEKQNTLLERNTQNLTGNIAAINQRKTVLKKEKWQHTLGPYSLSGALVDDQRRPKVFHDKEAGIFHFSNLQHHLLPDAPPTWSVATKSKEAAADSINREIRDRSATLSAIRAHDSKMAKLGEHDLVIDPIDTDTYASRLKEKQAIYNAREAKLAEKKAQILRTYEETVASATTALKTAKAQIATLKTEIRQSEKSAQKRADRVDRQRSLLNRYRDSEQQIYWPAQQILAQRRQAKRVHDAELKLGPSTLFATGTIQALGALDHSITKNESAWSKWAANLKKVGNKTRFLYSNLLGFKGALAVITAGLSLAKLDEYQADIRRTKLVMGDLKDFEATQKRIFEIAQKTGVALHANYKVYNALSRSRRSLDLQEPQILKTLDTIATIAKISGSSKQEIDRAILQVGHALDHAVVNSREMNVIMNQMPELSRRIATSFGMTYGELREELAKANVTTRDFVDAMNRIEAQVKRADKIFGLTLAGTLQKLTNQLLKFADTIDKIIPVTSILKTALNGITSVVKLLTILLQPLEIIGTAFQGMASYIRDIGAGIGNFVNNLSPSESTTTKHPLSTPLLLLTLLRAPALFPWHLALVARGHAEQKKQNELLQQSKEEENRQAEIQRTRFLAGKKLEDTYAFWNLPLTPEKKTQLITPYDSELQTLEETIKELTTEIQNTTAQKNKAENTSWFMRGGAQVSARKSMEKLQEILDGQNKILEENLEKQKDLQAKVAEHDLKLKKENTDAQTAIQRDAFEAQLSEAAKHYKAFFQLQKAYMLMSLALKSKELIAGSYALGMNTASALSIAAAGPLLGVGFAAVMGAAVAANMYTAYNAEFEGGRAYGGPVKGGGLYRVNEKYPEFFSAGGKDYLLPMQSGSVHPMQYAQPSEINIYNVPGHTARVEHRAGAIDVHIEQIEDILVDKLLTGGQLDSTLRNTYGLTR